MSSPSVEEQASARATEIRRELDLDDRPIGDIITVLEDYGIKVFVKDLGPKAPWAMYVPKSHDLRIVLLNGYLYAPNLRDAAAHELGHDAFRHGAHLDYAETVAATDNRPSTTSAGGSRVEQEASAFARCFLLPPSGVTDAIAGRTIEPGLVAQLAERFGTTYGLVARQMMKMQLIDGARRRQLVAAKEEEIVGELGRTKVTRHMPPDYMRIALSAYLHSKIAFSRLAVLLDQTDYEDKEHLRSTLAANDALHEDDRVVGPADAESQEATLAVS